MSAFLLIESIPATELQNIWDCQGTDCRLSGHEPSVSLHMPFKSNELSWQSCPITVRLHLLVKVFLAKGRRSH